MREIVISENEAGQRLDKFLIKYLDNAPKSFIFKMLRKKNITLEGKKAEGSEKLVIGDHIKLFLSEDTIGSFKNIQVLPDESDDLWKKMPKIVYEDTDLIIINKPAGMLSQKAEANDVSANEIIVSYLKNKYGIGKNETFKPGVCNRLDRNTSGLLIAGKTLNGLQTTSEALKKRTLKKYYLTIVKGTAKKHFKGRAYLSKDDKSNMVRVISEADYNLRLSDNERKEYSLIETEYKLLYSENGYSLLAIDLITGKTHQIRAHLASEGMFIVGEKKYIGKSDKADSGHSVNDKIASRQLLHAFMLVFENGNTVTADLPNDFKRAADVLFDESEVENAIMEFKRTKGFGIRGIDQLHK